MKGATRRTLSLAALIAAVAVATIWGFLPKPLEVDLVPVSRGPLRVTIEEEGRTRLKDRFVVSAPVAGQLRRIGLKAGAPVKRGQEIALLAPLRSQPLDRRSRTEAEAVAVAAAAALDAAIERERAAAAETGYIEKRLERIANLYAKRYVARDQLDQIEAEAGKARAVRASARAAVEVARAELERARALLARDPAGGSEEESRAVRIVSPTDGAVIRIHRESEGAVHAGEPLLEIGDPARLEVRVELLSSDAFKIRNGMEVIFERWGGDGLLTGKVRQIEPSGFTKLSSLGVEEQRVLVIVEFTSPPEKRRSLGDGYRLEARFVVWEGRDVLQIPAAGLVRSGEGWSVFVEERGKAKKREVQVGRRSGLAAQIVSGLGENERIVAYPDDAIRDGAPIRPRR